MNLNRSALVALVALALGAGACTSDRREPVAEATLRDQAAERNAEATALVERAKAMPEAAQIGEGPAPKAPPAPKAHPVARAPQKLAFRGGPPARLAPWGPPPANLEPARFVSDFLVGPERRSHRGYEPAYAFLPAFGRGFVEPVLYRPSFRPAPSLPYRASFRPPPPRYR